MLTLVLAGLLLVTPATTEPPGNPVVAHLESAFTTDPEPALAVSSPGSDAERYAIHQSAFSEALVASGIPVLDTTASATRDGGYRMCQEDVFGSTDCIPVEEVTTDDDGLITSFTLDGTSIAGRLGVPSEPVTVGPVTAQVRSSYRSIQADSLVVTLELSTEADVELSGLFSAAYVSADGRQVQASIEGPFPPETLFGGASTVAAVRFPGTDPGGTLRFELFADDCCDRYTFALDVPIVEEIPSTTEPEQ